MADQREKFISEAVVTGELDHPNIVPIYDLGSNDHGAFFYSMKCVKGTPWATYWSGNLSTKTSIFCCVFAMLSLSPM